ncbi:glycosyltransferase family 4 protein [Priestia megaterium]|uniref:glycosyltransferase family 4 protein n=1 Tax=Priestia megaterium TaxID=1404 RepID=UPI0010ABC4BB|nr:glycosyltransferase family 4 protein [Priestia megaterium]TJZ35606.1 glycosyltransferase family 4 protein [Priestia megaterium]
MSKKVLVMSQHFYPEIGSVGNRMKNIYKLLKQRGYDVTMLTTEPTYPTRSLYDDPKFWDDSFINEADDVVRVHVKNRKYSRSIFNRLMYYLEIAYRMILFILKDRQKYDVIVVTSPPIFTAIVALFAKARYRTRMILDIRDLWPESLKGVGVFNYRLILWLFTKVEKLLYTKADSIIVNSQGFIKFITEQHGIPRRKISFMPNAACSDEIALKASGQGEFKVIYAGNIGLAQDVTILMELAKQLKKHDIQLTIMGYGFKKQEFMAYKEEHKLTNVNFMKPSTRRECLELISTHHIGIVTLNGQEVFETVLPGKVVDYMTCSIPIVGVVSGYAKQIIETTQSGVVIQSHDAKELLAQILYLQENPVLRAQMAKNSREYVKEHFFWEKNISVLTDLIEEKMPSDSVQSSKAQNKAGTL